MGDLDIFCPLLDSTVPKSHAIAQRKAAMKKNEGVEPTVCITCRSRGECTGIKEDMPIPPMLGTAIMFQAYVGA